QIVDEGKDIYEIQDEFDSLVKKIKHQEFLEYQEEIGLFFDKLQKLPLRKDFQFFEPISFDEVKKEWGQFYFVSMKEVNDKKIKDKIYGGWFGRCAGCLLGKPIEGWKREKIINFLKETGQFPLKHYMRSDFSSDITEKYKISKNCFINNIENMVEDDDLNYTVLALTLVEKYGYNFTPIDFSKNLLEKIPILRTCTAERVVYKNLVNLKSPEISAFFRNPYREWIGAQIRTDFYGYINPGEPEKAVELAYKDASVTHIKNGVYGAMFISAMISIAFFEDDVEKIVKYGLNYIPQKSRLAEGIKEILDYKEKGLSYEEVSNIIHKKWDEKNPHHWCHVISNAQIVTIGLLWGNGDFGESICKAVSIGFDTDCNGATVGSIMGVKIGKKNLPEEWIKPLNNKIETGITGFSKVKITDLAKKTFEIYKKGEHHRKS
ncbi:MAG: ADP-ribosylglycohydrolase family protein, partial [bacterium]|nr:ADP-ribosylglycohydrolase family protein [bacterium]MDW8164448.1 ADP-ribosylglycohydrolase family protein [Candidatus Omnitrophota bacterium]